MTSTALSQQVHQQCVTQDYVTNTNPYKNEKYAKKFYILGIIQIGLSILSAALGIAVLMHASINRNSYVAGDYYEDNYAGIGAGIWCAAFFFTSGVLGVLTKKRMDRCMIVAGLTTAIISALACGGLFGLEIIAAIGSALYLDYNPVFEKDWSVSLGIHSTLCIVAFTEFVVAIFQAVYCGILHCCNKSINRTQPTTTFAYVNPGLVPSLPGQQVQGIDLSTQSGRQAPQIVVLTGVSGAPGLYRIAYAAPQPLVNGQPQQVIFSQIPESFVVQQANPNEQHTPLDYEVEEKM